MTSVKDGGFLRRNKQIFITSHTKEFLSLIKNNEDKVSLHRVYKTIERGSLVDTYKKGRGFNKKNIQKTFFEGVEQKDITDSNKSTLHKIFEDIGFIENDQYLIEELQNQLKLQRNLLENSDIKFEEKEKINRHLTRSLREAIVSKEDLELKIEEFKKPIVYVEDTYDQIYKIAYLRLNDIEFDKSDFEDVFKEQAPFTIRRGESAGKLTGRMRVANHDGYEDQKIIGVYDFDKESREQIHHLKKDSYWFDEYFGNIAEGFYRKRKDHDYFYALLLPIPERLKDLADLDWPDFASYVEIENLLLEKFLVDNNYVQSKKIPGGEFLEVKKTVKSKLWQNLFDLNKADFIDFKQLYIQILKFVN